MHLHSHGSSIRFISGDLEQEVSQKTSLYMRTHKYDNRGPDAGAPANESEAEGRFATTSAAGDAEPCDCILRKGHGT